MNVATTIRPTAETVAVRANVGVLNYRNERVVAQIATEGKMSNEEAEVVFQDTLRFLALADNGIKLSPTERVDLGWHHFILHTLDYQEFCQSHFGRFIHHEPGSGLTGVDPRLTVEQTINLARDVYGNLSANWQPGRGETCGSSGC